MAEAAAVGLFAPGASVFGQPVGAAVGALEIVAVGTGGGHGITSGSGKIQPQLYHHHVLKIPEGVWLARTHFGLALATAGSSG